MNVEECPAASSLISGNCVCNPGFIPEGNICIRQVIICEEDQEYNDQYGCVPICRNGLSLAIIDEIFSCSGICSLNQIFTGECICMEGYLTTLINCLDIDECINNPCYQNSVCENTDGSFDCKCSNGYISQNPKLYPCLHTECNGNLGNGIAISCENGEWILIEEISSTTITDQYLDIGSSLSVTGDIYLENTELFFSNGTIKVTGCVKIEGIVEIDAENDSILFFSESGCIEGLSNIKLKNNCTKLETHEEGIAISVFIREKKCDKLNIITIILPIVFSIILLITILVTYKFKKIKKMVLPFRYAEENIDKSN